MEKVLDKFLRYINVDTQSDDTSNLYPSSVNQWELAKLLVEELKQLGLAEVCIDTNCYVTALLPANNGKETPVIAFIAHMDTSPDMPGYPVKPIITEFYNGGDIILNKEKGIALSPKDFPELKDYVGQTIISTDGNTLLGADDKAGIAEIMSAMEFLINNPEVKHGPIKIAFTPDEEIGKGVEYFDVKKFNANYAYTIDGGAIGELEFENFNAAHAKINIQGRNIHPGYAKDKMINAILVAMELNSLLPINQRPEFTTAYDGFFHIIKMDGTVENASLQYIIRDHDKQKFLAKKNEIQKVVDFINHRYVEGTASLELKDQYYNMKEKIEPVHHIVDKAFQAMVNCGVKPIVVPIRGGTDGAKLSYMGLPCPNIFAGGHNFHGKFEYIPLESMEKAVQVIVEIAKLFAI